MKPDPRPLLPILLLFAGCARMDQAVAYVDRLPLIGSGKSAAAREAARMVAPDADCRRTLGVPECIIYVAPPGRAVARGPITPGDAQIEVAMSAPDEAGERRRVPTGTFMSPDGSRAPLGRAEDAAPIPVVMVNPAAVDAVPVSRPPAAAPASTRSPNAARRPAPPKPAPPKPSASTGAPPSSSASSSSAPSSGRPAPGQGIPAPAPSGAPPRPAPLSPALTP